MHKKKKKEYKNENNLKLRNVASVLKTHPIKTDPWLLSLWKGCEPLTMQNPFHKDVLCQVLLILIKGS